MEHEMLSATREAAWAAQSAAEAAWWALLLSGVAAVGTVGALVLTAHLASQADRAARAQKAVLLRYACSLLGEIVAPVRDYQERPSSDARTIAEGLFIAWEETNTIKAIQALDATTFPTPTSLKAWRVAKLQAARVAAAFRTAKAHGHHPEVDRLKSMLDDMEARIGTLKREAEALERHSHWLPRAISLKSFPAAARTTCTGRPRA